MINLIKSKTCCFSGHRSLSKNIDKEKIKKEIIKAINSGYDTFLNGMAIGFDTLCFFILDELKSIYDIKIVACVPYKDQSEDFSPTDKEIYKKILNASDYVVNVSENYFRGCMQKRNRFMVDNSSKIIMYLNHSKSGTYYTYNYAKDKDIEIIEI